jgi:hypothetical protein
MKKVKYKKNQILEVVWSDIVEESAWLSEDAAKSEKAATCRHVGYFLCNDRKNIKISSGICNDGDRSVTVIPWAVVDKINPLGIIGDKDGDGSCKNNS